jgi:hypothetical protein
VGLEQRSSHLASQVFFITNLIPTIKVSKKIFPEKLIGVIVPYGNNGMQLKGLVEFSLFRESLELNKTLIAEPLCP